MILLHLIYMIGMFFAVLFVFYYLRILSKTASIGPSPMSMILLAVGFALIASYLLIEFVNNLYNIRFLLHVEKLYFFLGNLIIFYVLYRFSKELEQ